MDFAKLRIKTKKRVLDNPLASRFIRTVDSNAVFLTFDDGPNLEVTPKLVQILQRYGSTATFFVTGEHLISSQAKAVVSAVAMDGHTIGNHGLIHDRNSCPRFDLMREMIAKSCRIDTDLVRAPYGSRSLLVKHQTYFPSSLAIHWSAHFEDWLPIQLERVCKQFPSKVRPGNILLLHDGTTEKAIYQNRQQVLELTKLICEYCQSLQLSLHGLASIFPEHYRRL